MVRVMGRKKSLGKKGGIASTLVDIYSIFFYIFVLILFFFIFAGAKGARELSLMSEESDKTIEARMLLLSLLRSPVELSDGRVVDIADMITLNELPSEDLVSELEAALTETMEGYFAEAFEYEDQFRYIRESWEMEVTYRSGNPLTLGKLRPVDLSSLGASEDASSSPLYYCDQIALVSMDIPLTYDPTKESQTAKIKFSVCAGLLGMQWGDI